MQIYKSNHFKQLAESRFQTLQNLFKSFYKCLLFRRERRNFVVVRLARIKLIYNMANQDYVNKNREWLKAKSQEPGVKALDRNIFYRPIKKGDSKLPAPNRGSVVTVHYTGKTINGKTFDSSRGGTAPAFRLRDLIPGWIIALQHMHPGDKWEVFIPAEQAYGKISQPGIPGGSTLIFEIELINVM